TLSLLRVELKRRIRMVKMMSEDLREMLQGVISESIKPIKKELQILNRRVTAIESNMATKQELEKLTTKIATVTHQVASNSEKLDALTEERTRSKQAPVDTKADATSLTDVQERQDERLESL